MPYTSNPINDFLARDAEQEMQLEKLPICTSCGEPIQQDDAVCFGGVHWCDECLDDLRETIG